MKSTFFIATSHKPPEEEGTALVPPVTVVEDDGAAPVARPWWSSSSLAMILPARGLRSIMAGLIVLALLVGAARWIDLDAVSIWMHIMLASFVFNFA
ncbi:unnamed protein product [Urochloa humidicola]